MFVNVGADTRDRTGLESILVDAESSKDLNKIRLTNIVHCQ